MGCQWLLNGTVNGETLNKLVLQWEIGLGLISLMLGNSIMMLNG
jgi:hypothetical protein